MRLLITLTLLLITISISSQTKVGINTNTPESLLDIRGEDDNTSGGQMQIATPSDNHFLRLFGGRGLDPKPFLLFANTDTFRIAASQSDYGKFIELLTIQPEGNVGISEENPSQKLEVNGKIKIGNDNTMGEAGTMRYNEPLSSYEGHNGSGWVTLDNQELIYQDERLNVIFGSTVRNSETAWGDTITVPETGNYQFYVSAYFSSTINEQYASGTPVSDAPYDIRGRLKIYINGIEHKLLECGNGLLDRNGGFYHVSFAPGTRSYMEVLALQAGDEISLTKNMQAIPAFVPNLSIPDLWLSHMDAFFIKKLD